MWTFAIHRRSIPLWIDCVIGLLLLVGSGILGTAYWKRAVANGQPPYYQLYFEPSVMIACGKGFVVARPQVPEMVPFLRQQVDRFPCDAIGPDAALGTRDVFQQGSWRYLMLAVGFTWRLFGVSWTALGPLFGTMFGVTIAAAYAIFRLGMGPLLSILATMAVAFSGMHLRYLPVLRDYAKAPMTLVLVFLLGALVVRRVTWKSVLTIAALYGAVAGVGYGFRPDFVSDIPPFFVTLALFLPDGAFQNIRMKSAAGGLCLATFLVAAWPAISTLATSKPGCQWHVVLLGFANEFDRPLGVEAAPYEVSREYLDEWVYTTATSYAARVQPGIGHIEYCESGYGTATRTYLTEVVKRFPADIIVRAYASVLRIVELPFLPVEGRDDDNGRPLDWDAGHGMGLGLVIGAIVVATAVNVRAGLFLVFFLLYFGGLPAVQFSQRHFFHFEFITWWAGGFLLQSAIMHLRPSTWPGGWREATASGLRAAGILTGCVAALVLALWAARIYQQAATRSLLGTYVAAPRERLPLAPLSSAGSEGAVRLSPHTDPETADFIAVDLDGSRCGPHATVAFRYDESARRAYSRVFKVQRDDPSPGLTHIFSPIYDGFRHLEFSDAPAGCVEGVYRVREPGRFSLLLEVMLRPGWRRAPLYQRLQS